MVVDEPGSDLACRLWDSPQATVATSILTLVEGQAALGQALRAGRVTAADLEPAREDLLLLLSQAEMVGIDRNLVESAGLLAIEIGLRGYDAVHLAASLALTGDNVVMVTWDEALAAAAGAVGLSVLPGSG